MKKIRLLIALLIIGAGAFVVVGEQIAGVSADAVINAQVLILRAPIDGEISLEIRNLGARVEPDDTLARLMDPRPDETRMIGLQVELRRLDIDLERLQAQSDAMLPAREVFARGAGEHARGRVRQIEARLSESAAGLEGLQSRFREGEAAFRRSAELARSGVQSLAELSRARAAYEVGQQEVQGARARIGYLGIELESARRGVFLGDSYNDIPYSEQRLRDMDAKLADLAIEIKERVQRRAALNDQISEERVRSLHLREGRIASPTTGIVWEMMSGGGEYVRKAQDVVRLVDCKTTIVTASVRESLYNKIRVGDPVQFLAMGESKVYAGTVGRLAGSGAETIYRSLAIGPSGEHLKRFDVMVYSQALADDPATACAVGRTGRIVFSARPLDFWRNFLSGSSLR